MGTVTHAPPPASAGPLSRQAQPAAPKASSHSAPLLAGRRAVPPPGRCHSRDAEPRPSCSSPHCPDMPLPQMSSWRSLRLRLPLMAGGRAAAGGAGLGEGEGGQLHHRGRKCSEQLPSSRGVWSGLTRTSTAGWRLSRPLITCVREGRAVSLRSRLGPGEPPGPLGTLDGTSGWVPGGKGRCGQNVGLGCGQLGAQKCDTHGFPESRAAWARPRPTLQVTPLRCLTPTLTQASFCCLLAGASGQSQACWG